MPHLEGGLTHRQPIEYPFSMRVDPSLSSVLLPTPLLWLDPLWCRRTVRR